MPDKFIWKKGDLEIVQVCECGSINTSFVCEVNVVGSSDVLHVYECSDCSAQFSVEKVS